MTLVPSPAVDRTKREAIIQITNLNGRHKTSVFSRHRIMKVLLLAFHHRSDSTRNVPHVAQRSRPANSTDALEDVPILNACCTVLALVLHRTAPVDEEFTPRTGEAVRAVALVSPIWVVGACTVVEAWPGVARVDQFLAVCAGVATGTPACECVDAVDARSSVKARTRNKVQFRGQVPSIKSDWQ